MVGEAGRDNTAIKTGFGESGPRKERDVLSSETVASGRGAGGGCCEVEWPEETGMSAAQWDRFGPSNEVAGVRFRAGWEQSYVTVFDGAVGPGSVFVPLGPPSGGQIGAVTVRGVPKEEMAAVYAGSGVVRVKGVGFGGGEID
jgi:hypothetical protein